MKKPICFVSAKKAIKKRNKLFDLSVYETIDNDGEETWTYRITNKNDKLIDQSLYGLALLQIVEDIISYVSNPEEILILMEDILNEESK